MSSVQAKAPPTTNGASSAPKTTAAPATTNGRGSTKSKKAEIDPVQMYESVRSRIAALEEEEGIEEEEDSRMAEQARSTIKGMSDSAVHARYVELYQQLRRSEREHTRERQRLTKDKDAAKSALTKANQAKTKLENIARELQKACPPLFYLSHLPQVSSNLSFITQQENRRLRDDSKRLLTSVEDAQAVIQNMKSEIERRVDDVKNRREDIRDQLKSRLLPITSANPAHGPPRSSTLPPSFSAPSIAAKTDPKTKPAANPAPNNTNNPPTADSSTQSPPQTTITIKVLCRYRAELYFKMSRQTKFERLFREWASRMEPLTSGMGGATTSANEAQKETEGGKKGANAVNGTPANGKNKKSTPSSDPPQPTTVPPLTTSSPSTTTSPQAPKLSASSFIYTHSGRPILLDSTPDDIGFEDGDVIVAVEVVDLTEGVDEELVPSPQRQKLRKAWAEDPTEAKKTVGEIFDTVVRSRLEDLLIQYELRERHFEAVIRSKQLELLLAKARVEEQKQLMVRLGVSTNGGGGAEEGEGDGDGGGEEDDGEEGSEGQHG